MKAYHFTCPHCGGTYEIQNYNMGFADAYEMRCDSCPTTLMVDFYLPPMDKLYAKGLSTIEKALKPCECGGSFRYSAPYRCKKCNDKIELREIAKQIKWPRKLKSGFGPSVAFGKIIHSSTFDAWKDTSETQNLGDGTGIKGMFKRIITVFRLHKRV